MKIFILADAEGISGVVSMELQSKPGSIGYAETRSLLMSDLNAAIEGALEAGAKEIVVYDMHYFGLNVIIEELHPSATVVLGKPPKVKPPVGMDESFDALMLVGNHTMAEAGGILPHTYTLDMRALRLNGVLMGEIGLEAAIAGASNVPLVFLSGDDAAIGEAKALLGDVEGACVKYADGLCLPPSKTSVIIRDKAASALKRLGDFKPYKVEPPFRIEIEFYDESSAAKAASVENVRKTDKLSVVMEGDELPLLWESFFSAYTAL